MPYKIGIDVGGTKMLGVIILGEKVLRKKKIEVPKKGSDEFLRSMNKLIDFLLDGSSSEGSNLGIAFPGLIEKGTLIKAPNLRYLEGFNFYGSLSGYKFRKISFANDASCYALGESVRLKRKNLVGITLGTGFGCGAVIDGKIYCGSSHSVEFGHTIIEPKGRKCSCGNNGCLEEYVSSRALEREAKKAFGKTINSCELRRLSEIENKKALQVCEKFGFYLGIGLGNISNILNPEVISISGGLSKNKAIIRFGIKEMKKIIYCHEPKIVIGKYESNAIGAANLA